MSVWGAKAGPVIGVIGGSGGVGASSFAAVLAVLAGLRFTASVLVDLDYLGGGLDVLLGIESVPGARWSELEVEGGFLDPAMLLAGLPRAGPCAVLAADAPGARHARSPGTNAQVAGEAAALDQVLAAASSVAAVVLDLPRAAGPERAGVLRRCDLVVVLARSDVPGLVSAHHIVAALSAVDADPVPIGVVMRRGEIEPDEAAGLVGADLLGILPPLRSGRRTIDAARLPRATSRVATGVLAGLPLTRRVTSDVATA